MLKYSSTFTTLLCSTASTVFNFSTALLFALSRFVFHPTFNLCHVAFFIHPTYFAFLGFLMGVKFPTCTQFREASIFPFWIHIIFLVLSASLHRLALHNIFDCTHKAQRLKQHDIYDCTTMPIFCCATTVMIAPRCPSFEATRYLWLRRDTYLLKQHDIYDCTTMPIFWSNTIFY